MLLHREFEPVTKSVPEARYFVTEALARLDALISDDNLEVAILVATELAANAVKHAGTRFDVEVEFDAGVTLRIAVADHNAEELRLCHVAAWDESGRGIALLDALVNRWGVQSTSTGKRVWYEVDV